MSEMVKIEFIIGGLVNEVVYEVGESLLESALRNGLNPPYSCMEGVCAACLAVVEAGQVDFSDDTVLGEEDILRGRTLTCQAKPQEGCIRLRINYDANL
jgi:ferredoxin